MILAISKILHEFINNNLFHHELLDFGGRNILVLDIYPAGIYKTK